MMTREELFEIYKKGDEIALDLCALDKKHPGCEIGSPVHIDRHDTWLCKSANLKDQNKVDFCLVLDRVNVHVPPGKPGGLRDTGDLVGG